MARLPPNKKKTDRARQREGKGEEERERKSTGIWSPTRIFIIVANQKSLSFLNSTGFIFGFCMAMVQFN